MGHSSCPTALVVTAVLCGVVFVAQAQTPPKSKTTHAGKPSDKQEEDTQLYRNTTVGFRYQIPFGWVDRTKEINSTDASGTPSAGAMKNPNEKDAGKAAVLLAVFERPPEATGDTVNSAVVIASESAASYPGLKKAEDYLGSLSELVTAKGFKSDGEPYALEVESRHLIRADFTKTLSESLAMRQCTLVLLAKGQIVSFTFIASSEDEIDNLMESLHFDVRKSSTN